MEGCQNCSIFSSSSCASSTPKRQMKNCKLSGRMSNEMSAEEEQLLEKFVNSLYQPGWTPTLDEELLNLFIKVKLQKEEFEGLTLSSRPAWDKAAELLNNFINSAGLVQFDPKTIKDLGKRLKKLRRKYKSLKHLATKLFKNLELTIPTFVNKSDGSTTRTATVSSSCGPYAAVGTAAASDSMLPFAGASASASVSGPPLDDLVVYRRSWKVLGDMNIGMPVASAIMSGTCLVENKCLITVDQDKRAEYVNHLKGKYNI